MYQPLPVPPIEFGHFNSIGARVGPINVPVERMNEYIISTSNGITSTFC